MPGEDGQTRNVEVKSLKKGSYCMLREQPCRLVELTQKPKATSKGNDRLHLVGIHLLLLQHLFLIFLPLPQVGLHISTGKKYEDTLLATLRVDELLVSREVYDVMDVDAHQATVTVMTRAGETKEDLDLEAGDTPQEPWSAVSQELLTRFEAGEEVRVVVMTALGKETIVEVEVVA